MGNLVDPLAMDFNDPEYLNALANAQNDITAEVLPTGVPYGVTNQQAPHPLQQALDNSPQNQLMQMLNDPKRQQLVSQLQEQSQNAIQEQRQGVKENEASLKNLESRGAPINFAPLAALVDSWTGSNLSKGVAQSETPEQYQEKIMSLKNAIQTQRQGLSSEQINLLKSQISQMNPLALARLGQRESTLGLAQDRAAAQAVKEIDNHPLMVESSRQLGFIQRDKHTIEGGGKITSQMLHEISNGIAAALSGSKNLGLGMAEMQDMSTAMTKVAQWESYLSNSPKEAASPQVRAQIMDTLHRLEAAYSQYQGNIAQKLAQGRTYDNNPQAQRALKSTVGKYAYTPPTKKAASTKKALPSPVKSGPKPGDVEDGHRFIGGDPGDPAAWEEVN